MMPNIDEIIRFTLVYARLKGDRMFTTTWAEILAYLGFNILIRIYEACAKCVEVGRKINEGCTFETS